SARTSTSAGTVRPSALAVFMLSTVSYWSAAAPAVGRLFAFQDAVDVSCRAPPLVTLIGSIGNETAGIYVNAIGEHSWQPVLGSTGDESSAIDRRPCGSEREQPVARPAHEAVYLAFDRPPLTPVEVDHLQPKGRPHCLECRQFPPPEVRGSRSTATRLT